MENLGIRMGLSLPLPPALYLSIATPIFHQDKQVLKSPSDFALGAKQLMGSWFRISPCASPRTVDKQHPLLGLVCVVHPVPAGFCSLGFWGWGGGAM